MNVRVETNWVHIYHDRVLFQVGFSARDHMILTTSRTGAPRNLYVLDPDSHEFEVPESDPADPDTRPEAPFSPAPQPRPEGKQSPSVNVDDHSAHILCGDIIINFLFTPDLGVLISLSRGDKHVGYALRPDSSELVYAWPPPDPS
jgi:hypothetical protein